MFDFLRNLKDAVVAESKLMGFEGCSPAEKAESLLILDNSEDSDYLKAIGYKHGSIYPTIMKEITDNNLQYSNPEIIAEKLNSPLCTPKRIEEAISAYAIMNFLKGKKYSSNEAGNVMKIANTWDANKTKPVSEIALIAGCTESTVDSVIKLVEEFRNPMQIKPFTTHQ